MIALQADDAMAQRNGFRIETDIFAAEIKEPIQQTTTLFDGSVAYDYSRADDGEITMVDPGRDRITLLSTRHSLRADVAISELESRMQAARNLATASPDELAYAYVVGASKISQENAVITVGDELLKYDATLQTPPEQADAVSEIYRQFADAVKHLNTFSHQRSDPPFARLALNDAIRQENALPETITQTAKLGKGNGTSVLKARLHTTWLLSKADRNKIEDIGRKLVGFKKVDLIEFRKLTSQEPVKAATNPAAMPTKG